MQILARTDDYRFDTGQGDDFAHFLHVFYRDNHIVIQNAFVYFFHCIIPPIYFAFRQNGSSTGKSRNNNVSYSRNDGSQRTAKSFM